MTAVLALGMAACSGGEPSRASSAEPRPAASAAPSDRGTSGASASSPARGGASDEDPPAARPRVVLEPPGAAPVTVEVEVARTPAQTQRGLMYRRELAADRGMLFLFARERQQSFWMRNTLIPLDMIFITRDMRVLGVVENAEPETEDPREVPGLSQFVLEVNAGFARANGIGPGTAVRFEDVGDVPVRGGPDDDEVEDVDDEVWE